jgi:hypothetical protein
VGGGQIQAKEEESVATPMVLGAEGVGAGGGGGRDGGKVRWEGWLECAAPVQVGRGGGDEREERRGAARGVC